MEKKYYQSWREVRKFIRASEHVKLSFDGNADHVKCLICNQQIDLSDPIKGAADLKASRLLFFTRKHFNKHGLIKRFQERDQQTKKETQQSWQS